MDSAYTFHSLTDQFPPITTDDYERLQQAIAEADVVPSVSANEMPVSYLSRRSGNEGWYTPYAYLVAAREVMGDIDLDPATSEIAQKMVQANRYFVLADDGLKQKWRATSVWINPPYSRGSVDAFASKLVSSVSAGDVEQAIFLTNNASETKWYHELAQSADALFQPKGRAKFWTVTEDGSIKTGTPLQGQHLLYFGPSPESFVRVYQKYIGGIGWLKS